MASRAAGVLYEACGDLHVEAVIHLSNLRLRSPRVCFTLPIAELSILERCENLPKLSTAVHTYFSQET